MRREVTAARDTARGWRRKDRPVGAIGREDGAEQEPLGGRWGDSAQRREVVAAPAGRPVGQSVSPGCPPSVLFPPPLPPATVEMRVWAPLRGEGQANLRPRRGSACPSLRKLTLPPAPVSCLRLALPEGLRGPCLPPVSRGGRLLAGPGVSILHAPQLGTWE